ncbi:translesion error-prone DNA polymerase V subunit UmuC [Mixta intestinalis]|uniref:DNA polymerase IV 1 n=1 Tax=Mixta intestinalis TaxID=1615494 RepID=A0A6P1Q8G2_9GAMM|nr:translesion error-prone DNA polymerase V subunit UmuC [Mixta intestinalis]QHM74055.1 DNA polymerase IV 1 [Mixta intestinalis]
MFALADVNSFYASCEQVFRPDLRDKAIVVLSNNDGCVIARSALARRLGVKMGEPWFQLRAKSFPEKIHCFSSNYALYASMSCRVMQILESLAPRTEIYSIDECFLDVGGISNCLPCEDFGRQVRHTVKSHTGLTVGVGMGPTKTLAKSAQWATKRWPQFNGILALEPGNPRRTEKLLSLQPVEEIWGCGQRISKKLARMGISTALELSGADTRFIRKHFGVVLERTVRELRGESCISLADAPVPKQQIVCSRSFGTRTESYESVRQAVCRFAERAAEKLRSERQYCLNIAVFIKTASFGDDPFYANVASERLVLASQDTRDIIGAAARSLDRIWRPGYRYAKAGVMLGDFITDPAAQLQLFDDYQPQANSAQLMSVIDAINLNGRGSVWFAGQGISPEWQMKRQLLSPGYTTRWDELPVARL